MRRIIQRIVTVVTTTTWKISWETDPHEPSSPLRATAESDAVTKDLPEPGILQGALPGTTVIETKEVHPPEDENEPDLP